MQVNCIAKQEHWRLSTLEDSLISENMLTGVLYFQRQNDENTDFLQYFLQGNYSMSTVRRGL